MFWIVLPLVLAGQHPRRMVAEWEPAVGTLIRWPLGIPSDLVAELASDDSLFVLVESYYQRDQAINAFTGWGVNMNHCRFIFAPTYSHWTRDWGPQFIFDQNGKGGIADPVFNGYPWVPGCFQEQNALPEISPERPKTKGWEEDDAVNIILADSFRCPLISLPVYLTGGNIMTDGQGTAVSTKQMLDENYPGCDEECFRKTAMDSLGINRYLIVDNPEIFGIQHIDCYARFLDEETVMVKEVFVWHPEYDCVEELAHTFMNDTSCYGRPFNVVRVYCDSYNGNETAAYTNSLILNRKVLVPLFGIASDQEALNTYAASMPGYEVLGFPYSEWYYYDALHCRTMGIFDRKMLIIRHKPLQGNIQVDPDLKIRAMIDDRSEAGLIPDELLLHWREEGSNSWNISVFAPLTGLDSFAATMPVQIPGKIMEYYISAADASGRVESLPRPAPAGFYSFTLMDTVTSIRERDPEAVAVRVFPTVFRDRLNVVFSSGGIQTVRIMILDAWGREVDLLFAGDPADAGRGLIWDGKTKNGNDSSPGLYFVSVKGDGISSVNRCFKTK
ncbi:MAG: agmatine deiminase family protein [Bacteroidales bacterium]|nr:agmatine deiminase family protein [Bacteroidales bacterium]